MNISKYCKVNKLNWDQLNDLPHRLRKFQLEIERADFELAWFPARYKFNSIESVMDNIDKKGEPSFFSIWINAKRNENDILIKIHRNVLNNNQECIQIELNNVDGEKEIDALMTFFGLEQVDNFKPLKRTAFIAFRFGDEKSKYLASELTRFLELLQIKVTTGRSFSPTYVSTKVKNRIAEQSLFFIILTPGESETWLTQEPILAQSHDKPIFMLKEKTYNHTSGVLADIEFIPFEIDKFGEVYINILEGLRDLGFLNMK